jgi:hypothetical protein
MNDGFEDSSTVSKIQLEEETVEQCIIIWTRRKTLGRAGYILTESEEDYACCKETICYLIKLVVVFCSFSMRFERVLLLKSSDKINVANYSGISMLTPIPKLFVKLVCDGIIPIIHPSISGEQHGFVDLRSTVSTSSLSEI